MTGSTIIRPNRINNKLADFVGKIKKINSPILVRFNLEGIRSIVTYWFVNTIAAKINLPEAPDA